MAPSPCPRVGASPALSLFNQLSNFEFGIAGRQQTAAFPEAMLNSTSPSIVQIQQLARSLDATLVEYSIIDEQKLFIWVVQPNGKVTFRQTDFSPLLQPVSIHTARSIKTHSSSNSPLDEFVTRTRSAVLAEPSAVPASRLARQPEVDFTRSNQLRKLHQMLIQPIADLLPDQPDDCVIFIPQGRLFLVPFAALQDQSGTYLIQQHTILIAPSIQVLALTHQQQIARLARSATPKEPSRPNPQFLVVGNPAMPKLPTAPGEPSEQLSPLPAAETEAQAVAQLLHTEAITGDRATETAVVQQMPATQIIHLATHGLLNYGQPDEFGILDAPGAIALSPSTADDGLLTAGEILNLKLKAELVVLSACDTGRGRITEDGVRGLQINRIPVNLVGMEQGVRFFAQKR